MDEKQRLAELRKDISWAQMACTGESVSMFCVFHPPTGAPVAYHVSREADDQPKAYLYAMARALAAAHEAVSVTSVSEAWVATIETTKEIQEAVEAVGHDAVRAALNAAGVAPSKMPGRVEVLYGQHEYHDAQGIPQKTVEAYPIQRDSAGRIIGLGDEFLAAETARRGLTVEAMPMSTEGILAPSRALLYARGMLGHARRFMAEHRNLIDKMRVKPAVML